MAESEQKQTRSEYDNVENLRKHIIADFLNSTELCPQDSAPVAARSMVPSTMNELPSSFEVERSSEGHIPQASDVENGCNDFAKGNELLSTALSLVKDCLTSSQGSEVERDLLSSALSLVKDILAIRSSATAMQGITKEDGDSERTDTARMDMDKDDEVHSDVGPRQETTLDHATPPVEGNSRKRPRTSEEFNLTTPSTETVGLVQHFQGLDLNQRPNVRWVCFYEPAMRYKDGAGQL